MAGKIQNGTQSKVKVRWPLTILTDRSSIQGEARKITETGILIESGEPLRMDKFYRISVAPPNCERIKLIGKVIWSNLYGIGPENLVYGMGFCFVILSNSGRQYINNMVGLPECERT